MDSTAKKQITVEVIVNASIEKVWDYWTEPGHIINWCFASDDWHAPAAENDIRTGGKFKTVMAAKDGSFSFDFEGIYSNVIKYAEIEYILADNRKVKIMFSIHNHAVKVVETFEPETENTLELQRTGWQAILDNFKKYTEQN
jgi:uncharacterized protein YndB with AHSA1/START domain